MPDINMSKFTLKDSNEHYLQLSEPPVRFEPASSVTNIFFDDTNGQVFTVRSGGVTGVTVSNATDGTRFSFTMEDRGPIISIKLSPNKNILAVQRSHPGQSATVEFVNFEDLASTDGHYSHTCKWKTAKILGFVWPKSNEIAVVTDHGVELFQVYPEKKQLKSLKTVSFSGAWFSWCSQSKIVLIAGNNGALLQPFSLNNSTISKLQKLDLESTKPVAERDVSVLRVWHTTWCALIRHGGATASVGPAELWLSPLTGASGQHSVHILKTGLIGRFAVNVVDELVVVHHQASQTSLLFDILEKSKLENGTVIHIPVVQAKTLKPCVVDDQLCPLYSGHWVVQQPDYIIDVRVGCVWRVALLPSGLAHDLPRDEIHKVLATLLKRSDGRDTVYNMLNQLVNDANLYLIELAKVFDEINSIYRKWADREVAKNTGHNANHQCEVGRPVPEYKVVMTQPDMYMHVLQRHTDNKYIVPVITSYIASLCKFDMTVQHTIAEMYATTLVKRGQCNRLRQCIRHGCLGDSRALACLLLSLGNLDPAAAQLAVDMMWRLNAVEEIVEVLLSWHEPVCAAGAARQAGPAAWRSLSARKLLAAAAAQPDRPAGFVALYHALENRNRATRNTSVFLKGEQCDTYVQHYKKIME